MIYNKQKETYTVTIEIDKDNLPEFQNSIIDSIHALSEDQQDSNSRAFAMNIYHLTLLLKELVLEDNVNEKLTIWKHRAA